MGDYSYVRKITIDNTKVSETDAEFAVLLNLTAAGSGVIADLKTVGNGGYIENTANGGASGSYTVPADLTFRTTADRTEAGASLDFEVEFYDATTGALIAWVQSGVNSGADVDIYMVFGNSDVSTSQEDVAGTWDSDFMGVWHLGESGNPYYDSTGGGHDSTAGTYPTQASGQIGNAQDFEHGSGEYFSTPDHADLDVTGPFTSENWVQLESLSSDTGTIYFIYSKRETDDPIVNYELLSHGSISDKFHFQAYVAGWKTATWGTSPVVDTLYYVVCVFDGTNLKISVDGGAFVVGSASANLVANAGLFLIGDYGTHVSPYSWDGLIDESRIASVARSINWVATVYANQNAPGTFYGVGGLEILQSAVGALTFVGVQVKKTETPKAGALTFTGVSTEKAEKSLAGVLTSAGVLVSKAKKALAGALTYIGVATKETHLARTILLGASTFVGAVRRKGTRELSGALTSSGASVRKTKTVFVGAIPFVGVVKGKAKKVLVGALASSGVQIGKAKKFLASTLTSSGVLARKAKLRLTGAFTSSGISRNKIFKTFTGTWTNAGVLRKKSVRLLVGTLTKAGALRRSTAKTLAGAFSSAGTAAAGIVGDFILLVGAIGYSGDLYKKARPILRGSITPTGRISRFVYRILAGALSFVGRFLGVIPQPVTLTLAPRSTTFTLSTRSTSLVLASRSITLTLPSRGG